MWIDRYRTPRDGFQTLSPQGHDGHPAGRAPARDNLLVFYLPDEAEWRAAVARLEQAGHRPIVAFNPHWDRRGRTFEDPDGYRVVLQFASWPAAPGTSLEEK